MLAVYGYRLEPVVYQWYRGRAGDVTHPLDATGAEFTFTPDAYGPAYVWVAATTVCSSSTAEFRVDVPLVRRRAVRR
jgi:hypothetical protein